MTGYQRSREFTKPRASHGHTGPALHTRALIAGGASFLLLVSACSSSKSASSKDTLAQLALYKGSDRHAKLVDGAKKEGTFVLYTSNTATEALAKGPFAKQYPFLNVKTFLTTGNKIIARLQSEFKSGKVGGDVLASSNSQMPINLQSGFLQEFWSPELAAQPKSAIEPGSHGGAMFVTDRIDYDVLCWNTNRVKANEVPQTVDDLLDPKWKGKIALSTHTLGTNWLGVVDGKKGDDFLQKLSQNDVRAQDVSEAALVDLVEAGEVALTPQCGLSDSIKRKKAGGPIDWKPFEPITGDNGSDGLIAKAPHPNAALLFLDYMHSKAGQTFMVGQGVISPRSDVESSLSGTGHTATEFQSAEDVATEYTPEEYTQKYSHWQDLLQKYFIK